MRRETHPVSQHWVRVQRTLFACAWEEPVGSWNIHAGVKRVTLSQSERQGKRAGCRLTNVRKHRKGYPDKDYWQSRVDSRGEPLFYGRSLTVMGKQLGRCTHDLDGVKGGGKRGQNHTLNSGESLFGRSFCERKLWYKPTGESLGNAVQEVGDGHSTVDRRDRITLCEERAISLGMMRMEEELA